MSTMGGLALTGLSRAAPASVQAQSDRAPSRQPLVVKPIFTYETYTPRQQTSWRHWGGIRTAEDATEERARIDDELARIAAGADFPLRFLPLTAVQSVEEVTRISDVDQADALLVYPAGGWTNILEAIAKLKQDVVFFVRYRSGPVYLWYEIVHPRLLRDHTDQLIAGNVDYEDVVVDDLKEITWRLRALCGLKNTRQCRIIAVGGAGGWAHPEAPDLAKERWGLDIQSVSYEQLGDLIKAARSDRNAVEHAQKRAADYLADPSVSLETDSSFVERCFLLEQVFRDLLAELEARAITINQCMGTIMPISETVACLPLSTLNDSGFLAFCESDFVAIPSGILLGSISGRPPFLHNPTYPHRGMITLAHCTAPRRMDGETLEPVRLLTHYESDYGAAPKVEMRKGQRLTIINPDFSAQRWVGLAGEVVEAPFRPICRTQIDVRFDVDSDVLAREMRGFHWMLVYGDYLREVGYALRRTPIDWKRLA